MRSLQPTVCLVLAVSVFAITASAQTVSGDASVKSKPAFTSANAGPTDAKASKLYADALKLERDRKFAPALEGFRKADKQDGGHCVPCEFHAYTAAKSMQDFKTARELATLLLDHVTTAEEKAEAHSLVGEACLGQGGYRIYEEPFQQADTEYQAALEIQPDKLECLYQDGVALAHLHKYDKARDRFQQYLKLVSPKDLQYARAKLFVAQPELARKRVVPNFHVVSSDGKTVSMESLAGKVVLIDFWATWCGPCVNALPHLKELAQKFEGQPLVVISISLDADENTWKNFVARNGMTWTQYRDGGFEGPIATQFAVKAIPTTFTIDADGFVQDQQVGDGDIEAKLKKLLKQATDTSKSKTVAELRKEPL